MILDRYLTRQFLPIFAVAISMFAFVLSLIDLFANLARYLNYEVPVKTIMQICFFYLPKSFSYALPISLLFAAAYTLGDLYAKNELTIIFSSGIPFWRFSMSLVLIGLLSSVLSFYFDDLVVIPTLKIKNNLSRRVLHQLRPENNSDVVIKARNGQLIYSVDYYDHVNLILNGVSIIEVDPNGELISHIRAQSAAWNETYWELRNAVIYQYENEMLRIRPYTESTSYREHPDIFRRNAVNVEELSARDAGLLVSDLKAAGLPTVEALANYYHRFSFAVAPFIVMVLSISMGGRFRKNILLMSLFASLSVAVVFYIMEMISMTMAGLGYIHPFIGAWFPIISFIVIGLFMLQGAKT
ncbi:MAG: LptF/LptG family permease [Treponema sp.]|nr:LptF/LptG family permease [Treponema sp.]